MTMALTEWLKTIKPPPEPPPRDSALGIVVRRRGGCLEVLLGRRSRTTRFMPGHLAFPGGRMDPADRPGEAGANARCASREIQEEIGISIDPSAWVDLGERVTPHFSKIRFRTRFFIAEMPVEERLPVEPPIPAEIDHIRFESPADVLQRWANSSVQVPPPCLPILRALAELGDQPLPVIAEQLRVINLREEKSPRIEFLPNLWVFPVRTQTLPPATHTNVWMPGAGRFVAIDPGSDNEEELDRLANVIERRIASGSVFDSILLTHWHPDHVSGAEAVARRFHVPVQAFPLTLERVQFSTAIDVVGLNDGDRIDLDGLTLKAHHTPGHAPDHLAFEIEEHGALIAGDLHSMLATMLILPPEGNMTTFIETLARMDAAEFRTLLPAHGMPLPGRSLGVLRKHRLERDAQIEKILGTDWTPHCEVARIAYAEFGDVPTFLTEGQAHAHLERLESLGRAEGRWHESDGWEWRSPIAQPGERREP